MNGKSKLALGTAQFGLDYGINNVSGKMTCEQVCSVMKTARSMGITLFDTAFHYGDSEEKIGRYVKQAQDEINIVSKAPVGTIGALETVFHTSLQRLNIQSFYGYLIHSFNDFRTYPESWDFLRCERDYGTVKKTGFSLYFPYELEWLLDHDIDFDLIQIPFSIFDQRFKPYFKNLKEKNVEIHVRSLFLQGLVFKRSHEVDARFALLRDKLQALSLLSVHYDIAVQYLCLNFAHAQAEIDALLIGIDHEKNLTENVNYLSYQSMMPDILSQLNDFAESNEKLIVPLLW